MASPNIETGWVDSLVRDYDITVKLSDMVQTFNSLVQNKKLTEEEKNDFLKQWLWNDQLKIDEGSNSWLIDKMIQDSIREGRKSSLKRERVKIDIEGRLDGLRSNLSVINNKEALTSITKGLREKYWKKPTTLPAQSTPSSVTQSTPTQQEVKPKTENQAPPVLVAEPVAPAPVQAPVLVKTPPVLPAHEKTKSVDKPVDAKQPAVAPKVIPAIEPTTAKQQVSAQKPAPVGTQTTTWNREIPPTNVTIQWVRESLQWYFANINNPTKTEIIKALNGFKDKTFDRKTGTPESSAAAIFGIQVWLRLQWINVIIDGVYWEETKSAILEFQKKYNKAAKRKLKEDWIPWTKTITALLDQLK